MTEEHLHDVAWWRAILEPQVTEDALLGVHVHLDRRAPGRTSRIHHADLQWAQGRGPVRVIVKQSHGSFGDLHLAPPPQWRVEGEFYVRCGSLEAIASPRCWYAQWSQDGLGGLLILDMLDEVRQWHHPIGERELDVIIPVLAAMHAATWEGSGVDLSWAPDGDLLFAGQMTQAWSMLRDQVPDEPRAFFDPIIPLIPEALDRSRRRPRCLVHGDLSPRNVIANRHGGASIIDFGTCVRSIGAVDVCRIAASCPAVAGDVAAHRQVCEQWHAELRARGVPDYPADRAWEDYRDGLLLNAQYAALPHSVPADESRDLMRAIEACLGPRA